MFKVKNKDHRTFTPCSSVFIVNFEYVIVGWVRSFWTSCFKLIIGK